MSEHDGIDNSPRARLHERRKRHVPFHFPERRTGFERRELPGWRGRYQSEMRRFADSRMGLPLVLAAIVVFNLIDYVMTLRALRAGGTELNPVMQWLFALGPETAALVKLLTAGAVVLGLYALRRYRRTIELSLAVLLAYSALTFWHVYLAIRIG